MADSESRMPASPTCSACGGHVNPTSRSGYVYATGRIEMRFPTESIEKEFAQLIRRSERAGLTDRQIQHEVLIASDSRYLARHLCWVLTVEQIDTYLLIPSEPSDVDRLIEAIRPNNSSSEIDVVIGELGPIAAPTICNGLELPIVRAYQIYSFDRPSLVRSIPRPETIQADAFETIANDVLDHLLTHNKGVMSSDRALNYLAVRYSPIYAKAAERLNVNAPISSIDVRQSPLSGARDIVRVIITYTDRITDIAESWSVDVDCSGPFPFIVKKLSRYYER